ncbi:MAG: recombinase family protein [Clostridiales bacterium]|nr:recombinase family protein [Clostridiales bacterium]
MINDSTPYSWCSRTVSDILARQEYVGNTVHFRYTTRSFKSKARIIRPKDEWAIFENTHPSIIYREAFAHTARFHGFCNKRLSHHLIFQAGGSVF